MNLNITTNNYSFSILSDNYDLTKGVSKNIVFNTNMFGNIVNHENINNGIKDHRTCKQSIL